ncbi:MAG TPA: nucleotidyltransferase family protein [Gemmatimonadaceae bacterium]|jgi:molybdenum cofactor cytidylyltransferase|nr:nucleotidyltransferase family protein [Gemmatimonadaceae bacterium]
MIAGLLLAAGGARRFGSQKLVARLDGLPLVRHAANALASATDSMTVVVGSEADAVRAALEGIGATMMTLMLVIENSDWASGLSSSLRCGVASLPREAKAVLVALGDQPRVDAEVFRRAAAMWREVGAERPIIATRYRGERGHPVVFDRSVFGELLATAGDAGARTLIDRAPERVAYLDVDVAAPRDVDSPTDLAALEGRR